MGKKRKAESESDTDVCRRLYCVCRQPNDENKMMMCCDFCQEWFHPACVGVDEDEAEAVAKWHCPGCIDLMSENPVMSKKGLLGFQGRVAPKEGWGEDLWIQDIDETVILEHVTTKRHRNEGYNLCREERVKSLSSNKVGKYIYFRSVCAPKMKPNTYSVYLCFKDGGNKLKWATCSCQAGIDGQCKHVVAVLYTLIDFVRQGVTSIPQMKSCTDKLQMWHVRKPLTDDPLLFSDIKFVKHDPNKPIKRELSSTVVNHNPVPDFAKMTDQKIEKLVKLYDASGVKLPVLDTIRSNECTPVLTKQQESILNLHERLFASVRNTSFDISYYIDQLDESTKLQYSNLVDLSDKEIEIIEKRTRLQSKNAFWFRQRQHRITASIFGTFCRLKNSTDPVKTFEQKRSFFTSQSVRHGMQYEDVACALFLEMNKCDESPVGLIVNNQIPFLGASPDRLIIENGEIKLLEVKCPYSVFQKKSKLQKEIDSNKFYIKKDSAGKYFLSDKHDYYYQIQGQLNITGIPECILIVFVPPKDIITVPVKRNENFFKTDMLPKLCTVYFEKLLPHFLTLTSTHK